MRTPQWPRFGSAACGGALLALGLVGCGGSTKATDGGPPGRDAAQGDDCELVRCPPQSECSGGACVSTDPCDAVQCDEPFVCSHGSCVNPLLDEDGDGFPVASDCDDRDPDVVPGSTAECTSACGSGTATCRDGRWQPCSAPTDCTCTLGEVREEPCGSCGSASRSCGADERWGALGACSDERECSPGSTEVEPCPGGGACSRQSRTCGVDCSWGPFGDCSDASECEPGTDETRACGDCGVQVRTCSNQCLWNSFGPCSSEGECSAGQVEQQACGDCGTQSRSCNASCDWGSWSACAQGACTPGATQSQACGDCGTQSRTCGANCNWPAWGACTGEGSCTPGQGESQPCGNCGVRSRTCGAGCAFGGWGGCGGEGSCAPGQTESRGCGNCGSQQRTCNGSCQWDAYGACVEQCFCGDGACDAGEDGASCGADCCDSLTSCSATRGNAGVEYCRSMNGGAYAWWTEPNATALCDEQRELCTSRYACGGTSGFCMGLVGGWVEGDGCVCGNDVCDPNENGGSCEQDCCDASTPCGATRGNGGVEYCRNMNGGGYGWWTEAGVLTLCDEVGEICVSTFECGGTWGQCVAIPNGWAEGGC